MKPITPQEINKIKIPDTILGVIDDLIIEKFHGNHADIFEKDIISKIVEKTEFQTSEILYNGWLNISKIKSVYEKVGWKVTKGYINHNRPENIFIRFDIKEYPEKIY